MIFMNHGTAASPMALMGTRAVNRPMRIRMNRTIIDPVVRLGDRRILLLRRVQQGSDLLDPSTASESVGWRESAILAVQPS